MEDILLLVLKDLSLNDIFSSSLVSKQYNKVFNNLLLWKMKLDLIDPDIVNVLGSSCNSLITFKKYTLINKFKIKLGIRQNIYELYDLRRAEKVYFFRNTLFPVQ